MADAGGDQIVRIGTPVTLDATGSFDPFGADTGNLISRWECFAAPEDVTLSDDGQTAVTTFTPTTVGHYYFRLHVRDRFGGGDFNRGPIDYVRVSAVADPDDPDLLNVNAGRPQQKEVGDVVTLDGRQTRAPGGATYKWEQTNPLGETDVADLAEVFGIGNCTGECYKANFDADSDVDGSDLALLAKNLGSVALTNADRPVARFWAGIARPHIFRLTVSDGATSVSETTIVAVNHPNVSEVLNPPPADAGCLTP